MKDQLQYKCPACGGAIRFEPGLQKLKCPYCETVLDVKQLAAQDTVLDTEPDPASLPKDHFQWQDHEGEAWEDGEAETMSVFVCNSCGGEIVGDQSMAATSCPYCGSPVVIGSRFRGELKPDFVIPFRLKPEDAAEKYRRYIGKKFLLPKLFRQESCVKEIKGIYVPYWIYDSKVDAFARFEAERVAHWSDSKYNYTETTVYDVFRAGAMAFAHIPVDGSSKMPDDLMESIEPFDFRDAVPFQTAYMAGFFADKYDVPEKDSRPRANERLRQSTIDVLRGTVHGYSSVRIFDRAAFPHKLKTMKVEGSYSDPFAAANTGSSGVSMLEGSVKYALYPVYLLTVSYKGENYTFAMNGQTGKFVGNLPMDKMKKNLTFAGMFAVLWALFTALASLVFR